MAGKDVSISYADGSGRAARGEALALCLGGRNKAKVMQAFNAALSITDEETAARSLSELRRKPFPSLAPLAKMQTVISIHDPRVLNVSVADLIDDQLVRKFDEDGELDALYATHSVV